MPRIRLSILLISLFLMTFQGFAAGEDAYFDRKDIFISGVDSYDTYRIPAVVVTNSGTVLAFAEGRKDGRSDAGNIDLLLKRSLDGGELWQPMQTVWDDGPNTCGNPCPVVDRDTGTVWLFSTHNLGTDHERSIWDCSSKGSRTVWVMKSDDDGASWSDPLNITADVKNANWTWYATGPCAGIQMKNGRLIIPCDHGVAITKEYYSHVIYSDDHGKSWQLGGSVPDTATSENQVAELSDSSLLMNIRIYPSPPGFKALSESKDGGRTWSTTYLDSSLVASGCQSSFISLADGSTTPGSIHLFSNPADSKKRIRMTVRMSDDDASSWPVSRVLYEGPSAYSCLSTLPDGRIACFFECGESHAYEKITFARFNLEWLEGND